MTSYEAQANDVIQKAANRNGQTKHPAAVAAMAAFLSDLADIRSFAEKDAEENIPKESAADGCAPVALATVVAREHAALEKIKSNIKFAPSAVVVVHDQNDINVKGRFGYTALHEAAVVGDKEKVQELLAKGANPLIGDNYGATAYDKALNRGFTEIAKILKAAMEAFGKGK